MDCKTKKIKRINQTLCLLEIYKEYANELIKELRTSKYYHGGTNMAGIKRISLEFSKLTAKIRRP
jgi:hypothetical protein